MGNNVDIIIPVHNRWQHTEQTLNSLFANTDRKDFKLYVINDGSDEETTRFLNSYPRLFTLINHVFPIGPGPSRNQVTREITEKHERSTYLYHSDNDVYFKDNWLHTMFAIMSYCSDKRMVSMNKIKVLGGSCHPYLQTNEILPASIGYIHTKDAVSGYSQMMIWETWDEFGPFDETMRNAKEKIMGSEDWAFCQKIIKAGYLVGSVVPEVVIPTGKTNTYGKAATGSETFKEYPGVKVW